MSNEESLYESNLFLIKTNNSMELKRIKNIKKITQFKMIRIKKTPFHK
jgi:hypothetical protein